MATNDPKTALVVAARSALQPLVRRMLADGVTYGRLERELRELFVEVAEHDFATDGRKQTDSRIAALTGINRKEVRRLRRNPAEQREPRSFTRSWAADLIGRWLSQPDTTGTSGRPLVLPYDAPRGPSFVKLAEKTTKDVQPRALLDVLVSSGAVEVRGGSKVALTGSTWTPKRGHAERLAMLAEDPPELIATMLHNIFDDEDDPRLQQKLAYDNLGSDGIARLRVALRREATRFLKKSDALLRRHDRDRNAKAPRGERTYAGIGVYYFESPREAETDPAPRSTPVSQKRQSEKATSRASKERKRR